MHRSLFSLCWLSAIALVASQAPTVTIKDGAVVGTSLPSKVNAFLGIPFAASPPERFGAPKDPKPWGTPLKVTKVKPSCMQEFSYPELARNFTISVFSTPMPKESEDCLYLNVWVPSGTPPTGGWPVMHWIFGGNLQFGSGGLPLYNGEKFAHLQKSLVVTFNYRTNIFGFPNSPELSKGNQNLGYLDQRKSLEWVAANVAAFGGNPKKVTIFGESAGAFSVKQLVAVPPSPLTFHAAIMQSQALGLDGGDESWKKVVAGLNCSTAASALKCIQSVPARKIKDFIEHASLQFNPVADGVTSIKDVRTAINAGTAAKVPIIIGTNANEGSAFEIAYDGGKIPTAEGPALGGSLTPMVFQCPAGALATALATKGYSVHRYFFNADVPKYAPFRRAGVYHTAEIGPVFKTYNATQTEFDLASDFMQSTWARFGAKPKAPIEKWDPVTASASPVMQINVKEQHIINGKDFDKPCSEYQPYIELQGL